MVITHETGHNLGSNHTQWCGWPGGAIDNCYDTEGNCEPGPAPVNGGTMMSLSLIHIQMCIRDRQKANQKFTLLLAAQLNNRKEFDITRSAQNKTPQSDLGIGTYSPVSYTHLDVYKRQA